MRQIYSYGKRRGRLPLLFGLIFGIFLIGYGISGMIYNYGTPFVTAGIAISLVPLSIGLFVSFKTVQEYMQTPIQILVLDNRAIQVRTGIRENTFNSNKIKDIRFKSYDHSDGILRIRTDRNTWHLRVTIAEAENIIQIMTSLNPSILTTRQECSSA